MCRRHHYTVPLRLDDASAEIQRELGTDIAPGSIRSSVFVIPVVMTSQCERSDLGTLPWPSLVPGDELGLRTRGIPSEPGMLC